MLCLPAGYAGAQAADSPKPPATPGAVSAPITPAPAFALPSDFAPVPGTPQYLRTTQQRQVTALLRSFEGIAGAEVVLSSDAGPLRASIVLKPQAGRHFTPEFVNSLSQTVLTAVPGLAAENLLLAETSGTVLYASGAVVAAAALPASPHGYLAGLLGGAALVALLLAGGIAYRWRRGPRRVAGGELAFVVPLRDAELDLLFAGEGPAAPGLVALVGGPAVRARLQRYARTRRLELRVPERTPGEDMRRAVVLALRRKALDQALRQED